MEIEDPNTNQLEAPGADTFAKQATDRLFKTTEGITTSADTGIEEAINAATEGIETAQEKSSERIESQFGREIEFQTEQFGQQRTTQLEGRRGFATNQAALRQLDDRTEKSLRDMEQRKQELLLAGEASAAQAISNLQVQQLQFKQQAEQQLFQRQFQVAGLGIESRREDRLAIEGIEQARRLQDQFNFQKETVVNDLRDKFPGINIPEGTTATQAFGLVKEQAKKDKALDNEIRMLKANLETAQERMLGQREMTAFNMFSGPFVEMLQKGATAIGAFGQIKIKSEAVGIEVPDSAFDLFNMLSPGEIQTEPAEIITGTTAKEKGEFAGQVIGEIPGTVGRAFESFGAFTSGFFKSL